MKIKFSDFGRCLICLNNPCQCEEQSHQDDIQENTDSLEEKLEQLCDDSL